MGIAAVRALVIGAALERDLLDDVQLRAAMIPGSDLGAILGKERSQLLSAPVEVIAFSDEEGIR